MSSEYSSSQTHQPIGIPSWVPSRKQRLYAFLAQISAALTFTVGVSTGGLAFLLLPAIPYLVYRRSFRGDVFVARHASQAVALALASSAGLLAYLASGTVGIIVMWLAIALLCVILVGVILIPVGILMTVAFALTLVLYPLVVTVYGVVGSYHAVLGKRYEYPYIGAWTEHRRVLAVSATDRAKLGEQSSSNK